MLTYTQAAMGSLCGSLGVFTSAPLCRVYHVEVQEGTISAIGGRGVCGVCVLVLCLYTYVNMCVCTCVSM